MGEVVESGAALAWRTLAALEGGALLVGGAALLAHRWRMAAVAARNKRPEEAAKTVLVTHSSSPLGVNITRELESQGCIVTSLDETIEPNKQFDALIVIGASPKDDGLTGLSELVTKDVYDNLKLLEKQITYVRRGGRVVWASCTGDATSGAFGIAYEAFDNVLKTQLQFIAKEAECTAVWVGRCSNAEQAAQLAAAAMLPDRTFTVRNFAAKVRGCLEKWLKIIS